MDTQHGHHQDGASAEQLSGIELLAALARQNEPETSPIQEESEVATSYETFQMQNAARRDWDCAHNDQDDVKAEERRRPQLRDSPINNDESLAVRANVAERDKICGRNTSTLGDRRLKWTFDSPCHNPQEELRAYAQLELAIQLIEPMQKIDYLNALRLAPHLVMIESNPLKFLLHASFNAAAAAQGIVRYWKRRREIFKERAFLPMTITGDGALTQDAIDFVYSGKVAFLPNDSNGRTVMLVQPCRRVEDNLDLRLRVSFYYGQLMAENSMSQKDGYVMIATLTETDYDPYQLECKNLVMNTFPVKSYSWHILKCVASYNQNRHLDGFVNRILKIHGHIIRNYRVFIHPMHKKSEMRDVMVANGFLNEGLPHDVGGEWEYSDFSLWIRDRIKYERDLYSSFEPRATHANLNHPQMLHESQVMYTEGYRFEGISESDQGLQGTVVECVTDKYLEYSRRMFHKSFNVIDPREKAAYMEALEKAPPQLMEAESTPDSFLITESYHFRNAARRCARYWQLRGETLGSDKHDFLNQTGEHALGRKDLSLLQSGFCMLLHKDAHGSAVLSIDMTLIPKGTMRVTINRCLFYMFSLLTTSEASKPLGAVLLIKTNHQVLKYVDVDFMIHAYHALPVRIKAVHAISPDASAITLETRLQLYDDVFIHAYSTGQQVLEKLEEYGMVKQNLSNGFGGIWGLNKFYHWQELRTRMEWRIPLGLGPNEIDEALTYPGIRHVPLLAESEKQERIRRLNVIHSRRKRSRKRFRNDALEEEYAELLQEREKLSREKSRLEGLVTAALAYIFPDN